MARSWLWWGNSPGGHRVIATRGSALPMGFPLRSTTLARLEIYARQDAPLSTPSQKVLSMLLIADRQHLQRSVLRRGTHSHLVEAARSLDQATISTYQTPDICTSPVSGHNSLLSLFTSTQVRSMSSVSVSCHNVIGAFQGLQSVSADNDQSTQTLRDTVTDQLARFRLFCGNIGALHPPASSLSVESRLQGADEGLQAIMGVLETLRGVLDSLRDLSKTPDHQMMLNLDDSFECLRESSLLVPTIGECITRLFRISRLIQKASSTDKFARSLSKYSKTPNGRFDERYDVAHVSQKFPRLGQAENSWLAHRLGRAITETRQFLSYAENHHNELNSPPSLQQAHEVHQPDVVPGESGYQHTKATSLNVTAVTPEALLTATDIPMEDDNGSYTTTTRSIDLEGGTSLLGRIPRLQDLRGQDATPFECPFCYRLVNFTRWKSWHKHVFADLRCYVCTFEDCDAPYFKDINQWFSHEMETHRVHYICVVCQSGPFATEPQYIQHIHSKHPVISGGSDVSDVLLISRVPLMTIPTSHCPCCTEWAQKMRCDDSGLAMHDTSLLTVSTKRFKRHLGSHLEQLALFAIPALEAEQDEVHEDEHSSDDDPADDGNSVSNADIETEPDIGEEVTSKADAGTIASQTLLESAGGAATKNCVSLPSFAFRIDEVRQHVNFADTVDLNGYWIPSCLPGHNRIADGEGVTGKWWVCNSTQIYPIDESVLPISRTIYKTFSVFFCAGYGFKVLRGGKHDLFFCKAN